MSLRSKTISGFKWSFIDNFANIGIQFIVGLVLARLLSPSEFGLIGMLTFFIAISQSLIDSGFSQALIRKQNCTDADYSTVFYFNFLIGIVFYLTLFFSAGLISNFYKEPQLFDLIRVLGLVLIINSVTILQRTILTKNINFKLQTRISIIASISSGIIGVALAYSGFGVWALVGKTISQQLINSFLLWLWNHYFPKLIFNKASFKEMFKFGSRLMISGLIDTSYRNIYYLIIGKFFSAIELGYYTRADQFNNLASASLSGVIQRVSYPVLASLQSDSIKLKLGFKKIIGNTMFISFVFMLGMAGLAKSMVLLLIGAKWLPAVIYLQLLCFSGMLYPLHALNLNILNVKGRSDLFLKLEIIKKILGIPLIFISIFWGIKIMIIGMFIYSAIAFFINSYWTKELINYTIKEQLLDISPSFFIAFLSGLIVFLIGYYVNIKTIYLFFTQLVSGVFLVITLSEMIKPYPYIEIKQIVLSNIKGFVFNKKE